MTRNIEMARLIGRFQGAFATIPESLYQTATAIEHRTTTDYDIEMVRRAADEVLEFLDAADVLWRPEDTVVTNRDEIRALVESGGVINPDSVCACGRGKLAEMRVCNYCDKGVAK